MDRNPSSPPAPEWSTSPLEIAAVVFKVGFLDTPTGIACNPYLVIDGEEAVLIDGGSRPDFPTVMMKILQTGCRPDWIRTSVYSHYDPDVCGSAPHFEEIIGRSKATFVSARPNHMFIRHITTGSRIVGLREIGERHRFASGRTLRFIPAPYAHSAGNFMTFDESTATLFTGDLFGSFQVARQPVIRLTPRCAACDDSHACDDRTPPCPLPGIIDFHTHNFPSNDILRRTMGIVRDLPYSRIAPQHGAVIGDRESGDIVTDRLLALDDVGADGIRKHGLRNHFVDW